MVQDAWVLGKHPKLHGAVFDVRDGILRSLVAEVDNNEKADGLIPMA